MQAATLRRVLLERRPDVWAHIFQREGTDLAGKLLRGMRVMAEPVRGMQYAGKASPSSGFLGMYFLLQLCQQVSVYGVGLGGCSGDNCRGGSSWHYWQEDTFKVLCVVRPCPGREPWRRPARSCVCVGSL